MASLKALCEGGISVIKSLVAEMLTNKVDKVDGKGLSTNDYTTAEKEKLTNIAANAQVNVIEGVQLNGVNQAVTDKKVNIDLSGYALKSDLNTVYKYKGSKANEAALPASGNEVGDVWNVEDTGANFAWTGSEWDSLGGTVSLSGYATVAAMNAALENKVDKVSGKGLSTNDYTTAEKEKLAGLTNYTHPTGDGNSHIPANGTNNAGKVLTATATAGVYEWTNAVTELTEEEIRAAWNA